MAWVRLVDEVRQRGKRRRAGALIPAAGCAVPATGVGDPGTDVVAGGVCGSGGSAGIGTGGAVGRGTIAGADRTALRFTTCRAPSNNEPPTNPITIASVACSTSRRTRAKRLTTGAGRGTATAREIVNGCKVR